eukprot:9047180-Lingulodinium_polyedra.AAC.1
MPNPAHPNPSRIPTRPCLQRDTTLLPAGAPSAPRHGVAPSGPPRTRPRRPPQAPGPPDGPDALHGRYGRRARM